MTKEQRRAIYRLMNSIDQTPLGEFGLMVVQLCREDIDAFHALFADYAEMLAMLKLFASAGDNGVLFCACCQRTNARGCSPNCKLAHVIRNAEGGGA